MRNIKLRTLAVAAPFRPSINERLVKYLASEQITVEHDKPLGIERIRILPATDSRGIQIRPGNLPLQCEERPDGIYIACGG